MAKIKVLHIMNYLVTGGVERVVINICNGLDPEKFDVSLVVLSNQYNDLLPEVLPHVQVKILPLNYSETVSPGLLLKQYRLLKKILSEIQPDIVHVSLNAVRLLMVSFLCRQVLPKVRFVKTEHSLHHEILPKSLKTGLSLKIERLAFRLNTSYLTAVSPTVNKSNQRLFGKQVKELVVIKNGVDEKKFNAELYTNISKTDFGFSPENIIFMHVGRLDPVKDHLTLLKAWKKVTGNLSESHFLRLLLVGEGPERLNIETFIHDNHLEKSIQLTGTVSNIPEYLAISDVALLTSLSEGLPLVLAEEMLMHLPLIVSDIESNKLLVKPGENGLLFPVGNSDALAESITFLAENPDKRKEMGLHGFQLAQQYYTLPVMLHGYENFYKRIVQTS